MLFERIFVKTLDKIFNFDPKQMRRVVLKKENCKNESYCLQKENNFNYHSIQKVLCGNGYFIPKRFIVIEMK